MKNNKKAWNIFKHCLIILFIIFLINYFMVNTDYYANKQKEKTILTSEKLKEFESDVSKGEYVDIKKYTSEEYIDNSSFLSNTGYKFSEVVNDFMTNKTIKIFKFISKFFS